jgi:hypothetical protein
MGVPKGHEPIRGLVRGGGRGRVEASSTLHMGPRNAITNTAMAAEIAPSPVHAADSVEQGGALGMEVHVDGQQEPVMGRSFGLGDQAPKRRALGRGQREGGPGQQGGDRRGSHLLSPSFEIGGELALHLSADGRASR